MRIHLKLCEESDPDSRPKSSKRKHVSYNHPFKRPFAKGGFENNTKVSS